MKNNSKTEQEIFTVLRLVKEQSEKNKKMFEDKKASGLIVSNSTNKNKTIENTESWGDIVKNAQMCFGIIDDYHKLLDSQQTEKCNKELEDLKKEFNNIHRLDNYDFSIAIVAAMLASFIDVLLIELPTLKGEKLIEGSLAKWIRQWLENAIPPGMDEEVARVPFDVPYNGKYITEYVEGLSSMFHRYHSIGHDPLLGIIVGVFDIIHGTITTIDRNGKIISQSTSFNTNAIEKNIFKAIEKEMKHLISDLTTPAGLPAPLMCIFNLFQFLSIGEEELSIAEIARGMYWDGYDAIHFISMSIPTAIQELFIRICYSIKRIKEGHRFLDSTSITCNREKRPKLSTMLFVSHTISTSINAGKVYFTKNPLNVNYPEWIMFIKYSIKQVNRVMNDKSKLRHKYVIESIYKNIMLVMSEKEEEYIFE